MCMYIYIHMCMYIYINNELIFRLCTDDLMHLKGFKEVFLLFGLCKKRKEIIVSIAI